MDRRYLERLKGYSQIEKCRACECLQGALVQLKKDRPELGGEIDSLLVSAHEMHRCLGCKPCPPADVWVDYLVATGK